MVVFLKYGKYLEKQNSNNLWQQTAEGLILPMFIFFQQINMKHLLVIFALALSISVKAQIPESPTIQSVELQIIKKGGTIMPLPKSPITPPKVETIKLAEKRLNYIQGQPYQRVCH